MMRLSTQAGRHLSRPSHVPYRSIAQIYARPTFSHLRHEQPLLRSTPGSRRCFTLETVVNSAVDSAQSVIMGIHNVTSAPWWITIPVVAMGISAIFRLPNAAYTNRMIETREKLLPLIRAKSARITDEVYKLPISFKQKEVMKRRLFTIAFKTLYKNFGIQIWKLALRPLMILPFWATALEALRRMCGGPKGFLGSLLEATIDPIDTHVPRATGAKEWLYPVADPSLTTEGCLWFTDLTQPDPYYILPTAVAVLMLMNILPKTMKEIRRVVWEIDIDAPRKYAETGTSTVAPNLWFTRLQRGMIIVTPIIPFVLADLPSALTLYWASSAASGLLISHFWLKRAEVKTKRKNTRHREVPMIRPPRP